MEKEKRLKFFKIVGEKSYRIYNDKGENLGNVLKRNVGAHFHWCFEPEAETYFSAGCMDEIREFMKNPEKYKEKFPEAVQ